MLTGRSFFSNEINKQYRKLRNLIVSLCRHNYQLTAISTVINCTVICSTYVSVTGHW